MCDGLAANNVDCAVIQLHCLDHARRNFYLIKDIYPKTCDHVLNELKLVYKADAEAKANRLPPEERLAHHQKESRPVMDRLGRWMTEQLASGAIEENSDLGGAVQYFLKRWTTLNEFHHLPGVPLSNAECERTIKSIIRHRKNSLAYKTEKKGSHYRGRYPKPDSHLRARLYKPL